MPHGNDVQNRQAKHWDWGWLEFPGTKINGATDADEVLFFARLTSKLAAIGATHLPAIIHYARHRQFLIIETKGPDEPLSLGQRILLCGLAAAPHFTVWILRGPRSVPQHIYVVQPGNDAADLIQPFYDETSRADIQRRVNVWLGTEVKAA